jgi:hypothetical protein
LTFSLNRVDRADRTTPPSDAPLPIRPAPLAVYSRANEIILTGSS